MWIGGIAVVDQVLITIANVALDLWTITSMLAVGMSLTVGQVFDPLRDRRNVILALVGSFLLVPLLALGLTLVLPLGDEQQTAVILLGACAGGPFIPQLVRMAKGDLPLAVADMALFLVVTIFYVPLVLPLLLYYVQVDAATIARDLFLLLLLPLVIGLLAKWRYAELAATWQPNLAQTARHSMLLMVVAGLVPGLPSIVSAIGTWLIVATILLALAGTLIGYALSSGGESGERKVMALGAGQRNLAAALLVAAGSFGGDTFVMAVVGAVTLTITMHIVAAEWGRGRRTGTMEDGPAAAAES
jgi:BASS family bile acid:Na+ symporter